jgi:alkylhydroperoxidase family enzyme
VKAVLGLLEKLTLAPEDMTAADVALVRAAGVSDAAIAEAMRVCALFNIINRLADAFDFDTSLSAQPALVAKSAEMMLRYGYKI